MYSIEELKTKAKKMQDFLEQQIPNEPNDIIDRGSNLSILIGQSGQMLADAKYHQDSVINGAIKEVLDEAYADKLSATALNSFIKAKAKDQNHLVNTIDRINATATHQLDFLRSVISYRKSEMNLI